MVDRELGFSHFVSCGNQIGTTIEDYVEYFVDDPEITVIAAVIEELKNPRKLLRVARTARAQRKSLVFFHAGRSAVGQVMVQSHTGALAGNAEILAAFLRRSGIVQVDRYDEFVETIELFAIAPRDETIGKEFVVLSGSGGGAAVAADALADAGAALASLDPQVRERIAAALPEFGSITNPIDGTGAIYDDPTLLPKIIDAILADPARPTLAASVAVRPAGSETMPVRGAGYPEGAFAMERLLDRVADELGLERAEVRRRNLVPPEKMPYVSPLKTRAGSPVALDSGDFPACQRMCGRSRRGSLMPRVAPAVSPTSP